MAKLNWHPIANMQYKKELKALQKELEKRPVPEGFDEKAPFRMEIASSFISLGRGNMVSGVIESGVIYKGDTVKVTKADGTARETCITYIDLILNGRKVEMDSARMGDKVGLVVRDLYLDEIDKGDIMTYEENPDGITD